MESGSLRLLKSFKTWLGDNQSLWLSLLETGVVEEEAKGRAKVGL